MKKTKLEYFLNVTLRLNPVNYRFHRQSKKEKDIKIIGMIRERNEALILKDTLDHAAQFVDGVVVFDDASTDESVSIALEHPLVLEVIENKKWKKNSRIWEETANRRLLHRRARSYDPEWFFYFDADERFEGNIRQFLLHECPTDVNAILIRLFDAYITQKDKKPYTRDKKLYNFRKFFGPEKRDILMIWRNLKKAQYDKPDAREPSGFSESEKIVRFYCQHYGKSLSIEHWESTCKYYAEHFPKYAKKWKARMGKAVHAKTDFGHELYSWNEVKKQPIDLIEITKKVKK